jgi:hypothetical protein
MRGACSLLAACRRHIHSRSHVSTHTCTPLSATHGALLARQLTAAAPFRQRGRDQGAAAAQAQARAYMAALPDELQPGAAGEPVPTRVVGCGYGKDRRLHALWLRERRGGRGAAAAMPEVPFMAADCEVGVFKGAPQQWPGGSPRASF